MTHTPTAQTYLSDLTARMTRLLEINGEAIGAAAAAIQRTAEADGLVYVFGTGHSHTLSEEVHYRAGGLALTVPILATVAMVHEGAVASTAYERMPGLIANVLVRYPISARDILIVVSNSGINAAPVEAARYGKERGATVIALTSVEYSTSAANGRPRIADIADIVLDNLSPAGDAVISLPGTELRAGPVSTSLGAALLNAVLAEAAARLQGAGTAAPIYRSANLPGANEINQALVTRYRPRNPHL